MERNLYLQGKVQSQGTFLGLISNTPGESPQLAKVGDLYANRSLPSSPLHSSKYFSHYRHQTHQSVFLFHLNSPTFFITFSTHLCHAQSVKTVNENERWYIYIYFFKFSQEKVPWQAPGWSYIKMGVQQLPLYCSGHFDFAPTVAKFSSKRVCWSLQASVMALTISQLLVLAAAFIYLSAFCCKIGIYIYIC